MNPFEQQPQTPPQGEPPIAETLNSAVENTNCNLNTHEAPQNNTQSNAAGQPCPVQPAPCQPVYAQPPVYQIPYQTVQLYYEKRAVAKTAGKVGGALLLFYLFVNALQLLILFGLRMMYEKTQNPAFNIRLLLEEPIFSLLLNTLLSFIGFGGAALCLVGMLGSRPKQLMSLKKPNANLLWPMVLMAMGGCYVANIGVSMLQQRLKPIIELKSQDLGTPQGLLGFAVSVLATACAPALIEEFFFRGVLLGSLRKFGDDFAIFTSAVLFGLIHGNLIQIPFAFMVGLLLGFAVVKTGSLWTGILIHFFNNLLAVLQQYGTLYLNENLQVLLNYVVILLLIIGGIFAAHRLTVRQPDIFTFAKTPHLSTATQRFGWVMSRPTVIVFLIITFFTVLTVQLQ